jgi:predicted ribosome quality control (RQC) complex YloA/Tae2 family protein
MGSKGKPYRTIEVDGWEILVGRSDADNDYLTFKIADPRDLWFHSGGGTPGSHVVLRNPDHVDPPREIIEAAAQLAAWYSKARGAPRVVVHYCRAADISKPRGAPRGQVQLKRFQKVKVVPRKLDD